MRLSRRRASVEEEQRGERRDGVPTEEMWCSTVKEHRMGVSGLVARPVVWDAVPLVYHYKYIKRENVDPLTRAEITRTHTKKGLNT